VEGVHVFEAAVGKLEDCRSMLEGLEQATDSQTFRASFSSFLNSSRAITYALQKEGSHLEGFERWYEAKRAEMKSDELLRFVHEARTDDFHEGRHRLIFPAAHLDRFSSAEEPWPPNATGLVWGGDGPFWVLDEGTPRERRVPVTSATHSWSVAIEDPPATHRGVLLVSNDPISICRATLAYMEELVYEARGRFL
jgi:hypothetical protein